MGSGGAAPSFRLPVSLGEKEQMGMRQKRAYQYRCYPTPSQRQMLARTFGCARFVYNWGLRLRTDAYRQRGEHLFYRDTSAALTQLKQQPAYGWLNEVSCVPPQQALRHLDKRSATSLTDGRSIRRSKRSMAASRRSIPPRPSPGMAAP